VPRRLLASVAAALVATGLSAAAATAYFAATGPDARGAAGTGQVRLGGLASGETLFDGTGLRPGAPARERLVTVTNDGTTNARLLLDAVGVEGALSPLLLLTVERCADTACASATPVASGAPAELGTARLGRMVAGDSRTVRVRLSWPLTEPLAEPPDGASASLVLRWSLVAGSEDS
jgi:hypothetical protein